MVFMMFMVYSCLYESLAGCRTVGTGRYCSGRISEQYRSHFLMHFPSLLGHMDDDDSFDLIFLYGSVSAGDLERAVSGLFAVY